MKCNFYLLKEETGHRRREVVQPLVIFDPSESSSLMSDTNYPSFRNINGSSCHKRGNNDDKKHDKSCLLPQKVCFKLNVFDATTF